MNLIRFHKEEDWGQDYYLQVLFTERWALFQGSVSWCVYPSYPYLQFQCGMGALMSIIFQVHKFGISFAFFDRTWNFKNFDSADGVV